MNVKKHFYYGNQDWITPYPLINALGGDTYFDLDPSAAINQPWATAKNHYTIKEDGLKSPWFGNVFLSPPWGSVNKEWITKAIAHKTVIALLPNRTDTKLYQDLVLPNAHGILLLRGRICYHDIKGNSYGSSTSASALVAFDPNTAKQLKQSTLDGFYIELKY